MISSGFPAATATAARVFMAIFLLEYAEGQKFGGKVSGFARAINHQGHSRRSRCRSRHGTPQAVAGATPCRMDMTTRVTECGVTYHP